MQINTISDDLKFNQRQKKINALLERILLMDVYTSINVENCIFYWNVAFHAQMRT